MNVEKEYIKNVENLVPCPEIALQVMEMAHSESCNMSELSNTIEKDPNLTANMLRMANSAYFGHMKKITSIHDIIVRLGLESVKLIAITSASVGVLKSPQKAYNLEPGSLWQHCYATAVMASIIGKYAKVRDKSILYTAGLLHDIGKVILNRPLQVELLNRGEVVGGGPFLEVERDILHTDHARVGEALLEQWGLPKKITVPVGFHHSADKATSHQLTCLIVQHSNMIVESIGISSTDELNQAFTINEYVEQQKELPSVPGFEENMEAIIDEFFEQVNDASTLEFET